MSNVVTLKRDNDDLVLKFGVQPGTGRSKVKNVTMPWGEFVKKLSQSYTIPLTMEEYRALSRDQQAAHKNANGHFVGAAFEGGKRGKTNTLERQMLTFDIDNGTPELLDQLLTGRTGLGAREYVVASTLSHGGDKIKLRVIVPLLELLPRDDFEPLARLVAKLIDPAMTAIDKVSFRLAQFMYWPAHCADVTPVFHHQRGPLVEPGAVLATWDRNYLTLPRLEAEDPTVRPGGVIKAPSGEKPGIMGALNRLYRIGEGVELFLADIYEVSERDGLGEATRFTFLAGTTTNGAQAFEDGYFHSHQSSDPACDQNVHLFDLIALHRYGHLDKNVTEDTRPMDRPSFKAMRDEWIPENAPEVMAEVVRSNYAGVLDDDVYFEDNDHEDWLAKLDVSKNGLIKNTLTNLIDILKHDHHFKGAFALNEFTKTECLVKPLHEPRLNMDIKLGREGYKKLTDDTDAAVRQLLEAKRGDDLPGYGLIVSDRNLKAAITRVSNMQAFHPIRDWLDSLPAWDGVSRLSRLWSRACGTRDTPYYRLTASNFLAGAVARIYEPGCKFDFLPVLIGPQGILKSTLVQVLASPAWYGETEGHFDNKQKQIEAASGKWFLEMGEMVHFTRAKDDESIKMMLSGQVDSARLAYDKRSDDHPRQFVFIGTTNREQFLREFHRRVWPIVCNGDIDIKWVHANRAKLFAEAIHVFREAVANRLDADEPLPLHLPKGSEAEVEHAAMQGEHRMVDEVDMMLGMAQAYLDGETAAADTFDGKPVRHELTCGADLLENAFGVKGQVYDRRAHLTMNEVLRRLAPEWVPTGRVEPIGGHGRQRTYRRA